ncbi:MAG: ABC transporter ATP-binding protein [Albidovulum sp.]|nr:ABC transporter ATP-binding protein [Albidovulum sp.]
MRGVALEKVVKKFGPTVVIPELDLEIEESEFVVIVGPSGCGKSTTLRMIAGLEDISRGKIHIGGKDVTWLPPKQRDIAMVFQSYALYPHMDVAGNMSFALRLAGKPRAEIEERVRRAAEMLELTDFLARKPKDLSGGQRQRVAMGRSIVRDAYCFLFDEPLSNLDAKLRSSMRTELAILHKKLDRTMIYVTHDQIEAMTMADRIVIMDRGLIQQVGTPREVYNSPVNTFVAGFIGSPSMNFLDGELHSDDPVKVKGQGFDLPLSPELTTKAKRAPRKDVIAGLRPEHFAVNASRAGSSESTYAKIDLDVSVAEYIGSSQFLAATIGEVPVTASVEVGPTTEPMTSGTYLFDTSRLYLFDRESGNAI